MNETGIIVWGVMTLVFLLVFIWSMKALRRRASKWLALHLLLLVLSGAGLGCLVFYLGAHKTFDGITGWSPHLVWGSRLSMLLLGSLHVWAMYKQAWVKRDHFSYENDGFIPECSFTLLGGLLTALGFVIAPQLLGLLDPSIQVSRNLWDVPLVFGLPFFVLKLSDLSGQVPYRLVEILWVFPLEPVVTDHWPWRKVMQVNFQVKRSLLDEYHLFRRPTHPWLEAPKEAKLGDIFRLIIQERRRRPNLPSIQDLGDEYHGKPQFWWLFCIKVVWWKPSTWKRKPRYLNPNLNLEQNKVTKDDIILARRVPWNGGMRDDLVHQVTWGSDPEKTKILHQKWKS